MFDLTIRKHDHVVFLTVDGKLTGRDYDLVLPRLEDLIKEHGKLKMVIQIKDVDGIAPEAIWKDLQFTARHFRDFDRVAVVGDSDLSEWIARLGRPFAGEVRHFDADELHDADRWVRI